MAVTVGVAVAVAVGVGVAVAVGLGVGVGGHVTSVIFTHPILLTIFIFKGSTPGKKSSLLMFIVGGMSVTPDT